MKLVARTYAGLEEILAKEIKALGGEKLTIRKRAVEYVGSKELMYKSNLWLRTAIDVLTPIHEFTARNDRDLYKGVQSIDWEKYLDERKTFSITPIINSSHFTHSQYAVLRTKDAIVDQIREKRNSRPNIDRENPDLKIVLRISEHKCYVLLNSSGDSLFKRGYRRATGLAPINEVLAAGIIELMGWSFKDPFIDPMCGSGTFCIEAGMKAFNIAPGILRSEFAFEKWDDFDADLWDEIYFGAKNAIVERDVTIRGYDISSEMVSCSKKNMADLRELRKVVKFEKADFFTLEKPFESGILVTNPPYDKRIELENDKDFYNNIGSRLKHFWSGYDAWIFSANLPALKVIGLRPKRRIQLFNGPDEGKLVHLPLYQGTKRNG